MREVIQYEDINGVLWGTRKDAVYSDNRIIISKHFQKYASDCHCFDADEFIRDTRGNVEVISALLKALEIDNTKIAVERTGGQQ